MLPFLRKSEDFSRKTIKKRASNLLNRKIRVMSPETQNPHLLY